MCFAGQKVYHYPGRCIPRRHGHAGESQRDIVGLEAVDALPVAGIGTAVARGGVGAGGRKGEDQAAAAIGPIPEAQEVTAKTVAPGAALDVRSAHMQDAHVYSSRCDERVQLTQETVIGRGCSGGHFQGVEVSSHKRIMRHAGPGGNQRKKGYKAKEKPLFHGCMASSTFLAG